MRLISQFNEANFSPTETSITHQRQASQVQFSRLDSIGLTNSVPPPDVSSFGSLDGVIHSSYDENDTVVQHTSSYIWKFGRVDFSSPCF